MKKFIAIALLAVANLSFASTPATIDLGGLSAEQVATLAKTASEMKSPVQVSENVRKETEAWGSLGANMGKAVVSAAKEVGVAANEFSQTSLGKIVVGLVVYKIAGREILGVLFGSLVFFLGTFLVVWIAGTKRFGTVTYEYVPTLFGLYNAKRVKEYKITDDQTWARVVSTGVVIAATLVVSMSLIF